MGYAEVLQALGAEARREEESLAAGAVRERQRILDEARRQAAEERQARLAAARVSIEARRRNTLAAARREQAGALLVESRRLLDELQEGARRRLATLRDAALEKRLLDEVLAEAGAGPAEIYADPGGGAVVRAGNLILDNTLASRLAKLWPAAEARIAALLFGEGDGAL